MQSYITARFHNRNRDINNFSAKEENKTIYGFRFPALLTVSGCVGVFS